MLFAVLLFFVLSFDVLPIIRIDSWRIKKQLTRWLGQNRKVTRNRTSFMITNQTRRRNRQDKNQPEQPIPFFSWGEEQHLGFVVLPKLKIDGPMYDSTWLDSENKRRTTTNVHSNCCSTRAQRFAAKMFYQPLFCFNQQCNRNTMPIASINLGTKRHT